MVSIFLLNNFYQYTFLITLTLFSKNLPNFNWHLSQNTKMPDLNSNIKWTLNSVNITNDEKKLSLVQQKKSWQ